MKAGVIGVGKLGGAIAFGLAREVIADEIVLVDAVKDLAWAQAEDIRHGLAGPRMPHITEGAIKDLAHADVLVVAAGQGRKPGQTRLDLLQANTRVVAEVGRAIARVASDATLVVLTNPVDVMTTIAWRATGFPSERVLGSGALLDSVRLRMILADRLRVEPSEVEAVVLGEHGNRAVPIFSRARIRGKPVSLSLSERTAIERTLREVSGRIIDVKGGTAFGPAGTTIDLIRALIGSRPTTLPASVILRGQYGAKDIAMGAPAVLGNGRVLEVEDWPLSDEERTAMAAAAHDLQGFVDDASVVHDLVPRSLRAASDS